MFTYIYSIYFRFVSFYLTEVKIKKNINIIITKFPRNVIQLSLTVKIKEIYFFVRKKNNIIIIIMKIIFLTNLIYYTIFMCVCVRILFYFSARIIYYQNF